MKRANLLACDFTSAFIAAADGGSVAVYSGDDEQPLWRHDCADEVVGLGATDEEIIVLDKSGKLSWWDGEAGEPADTLQVEGAPRALAVDADGVAAVLTKRGAQILDPGDEPLEVPLREGRCLAWSEPADRIAVGTASGVLAVFDAQSGEELGRVELPNPPTSIAWSTEEERWLVTAGELLCVVDGQGRDFEALDSFAGKKADCVALSADGSLLAVRHGAHEVAAYEYPDLALLGRISVGDRSVTGVSFASRQWLCVGLDRGDANKVSLRTGAVRRTVPHGDETRTWKIDVDLPGAKRPRKAATRGGQRVRKSAAAARSLPRSEREMNTPSLQSLLLLGSVTVSTIVMWGSAHFYCNDHSPLSRKPREVGTVELASTPKDAAIEMVHRLETFQFDRALELTEGTSSTKVEEALRACESSGRQACDAKRNQVMDKVLTTAELVSQSGQQAKARVTSRVKGGATTVYEVDLKHSGPIWKVTKFDKQG